MFGVSPKFFVVRCGENFRVEDYICALDKLPPLSLDSFQGEILRESQIADWERNAYKVEEKAERLALRQDMFVAHFLIDGTTSPATLKDNRYDILFWRVLDILKAFKSLKTVSLPIGKYQGVVNAGAKSLLSERLRRFSIEAGERGLEFGVEVITGALLDYRELSEIREKYSLSNFGLNLDTGHANLIMHEEITLIPSLLPVYGTHIKDNDGKKSDELKPGDGNIDWKALISALEDNGYRGSYDFELSSPDDGEYIKAQSYIKQFINQNKTGGN